MVRRRDITVRVSRLTMSDLASKDMTSRCKQNVNMGLFTHVYKFINNQYLARVVQENVSYMLIFGANGNFHPSG